MVNLDLSEAIRKAMQGQMDHFKEELRILQELAWDQGYQAGKQHDPRLRSTWKTNPHRKVEPDGTSGREAPGISGS